MSDAVAVVMGFLIIFLGGPLVWLRITEHEYGPLDEEDRSVPWLDGTGEIRRHDD